VEDGEVRQFGIEIPPFTMDDIWARADLICNMADDGVLPEACEQNDYPCPFAYLHETVRDDTDTELDLLIADWAKWDAQEKLAKDTKALAAARVRKAMGDRTSYDSDLWKVSIYEQAGPARWDEARMVEDGIDPESYKKRGSPSVRMKITVRDEEGSE
jgi:hypothetical protein